ncbi:hypothetical protein LXL04_020409 [Taraxacum kok-saghyz]
MKIQDFHKTNTYELTNLCVGTFKTHAISDARFFWDVHDLMHLKHTASPLHDRHQASYPPGLFSPHCFCCPFSPKALYYHQCITSNFFIASSVKERWRLQNSGESISRAKKRCVQHGSRCFTHKPLHFYIR